MQRGALGGALARDSWAHKKSSHCLSLLIDGGGSHEISVQGLATYFLKGGSVFAWNKGFPEICRLGLTGFIRQPHLILCQVRVHISGSFCYL